MESIYGITIAFALVAGTAAALLSLLTWRVFRQTPFGRAIFFLTFVMSIFIVYHALLLTLAAQTLLFNVIESIVYTGFAIVIWWIALTHPVGKPGGS
ncbi:hypothetical protein AArcSl_1591 [Halalkaliarchaeum desulfuricum]|uniref:Uncharacterized protein n=1 Tax=Halalkaliarchaeum desulfuricum TaxID=2055893 RepID=A0A343TJE8_9EURY|nr:hypothetical protein [Halalkaliarchaeum desulfuricum]AUX09220.1 hypothetical protein AArcSl_1591 [Halalkaliarchaeum desulfuricum]